MEEKKPKKGLAAFEHGPNPFKPWKEHMKSTGKPREPKETRPPQSKKWTEK